jgi:hypothetical protein
MLTSSAINAKKLAVRLLYYLRGRVLPSMMTHSTFHVRGLDAVISGNGQEKDIGKRDRGKQPVIFSTFGPLIMVINGKFPFITLLALK